MEKNFHNTYRVICSIGDFFLLLDEYAKLLNELSDDLVHKKYAELIMQDELYQVASSKGYDVPNPLKNFKKPGLSIISTAYFRLVDAEDKIKNARQSILPEFDYSAKISFVPYQNGFIVQLNTAQRLYQELFTSNPFVENYDYYEDEARPVQVSESIWKARKEVLKDIDFSMAYTRNLYEGLRNIRPKYLLGQINRLYSFQNRLNKLAHAVLSSQLESEESFLKLNENERMAYLVSPDAQVRTQAIQTQFELDLIGQYDAEYLLQKFN